MPIDPDVLRAKLGRLPSPPDDRDHPLALYVPQLASVIAELPKRKVPWTPNMPVYDQGMLPACVGFANALSATIDQRRDFARTAWYDGAELYDLCKAEDGIPNEDGTYPRVALKVRSEKGALIKKSARAADVGHRSLIARYAALTNLDEIKSAIYLYGSAVLGSTWYDEWFNVPASKTLPKGYTPAGGHCYLVLGWSDYKQAFLLQNSWGPGWGYSIGGCGGRAWLPYTLVDFHDFEAWRSIDLQDQ